MGVLDDSIRLLNQYGITEILIPFMLVFVLIYAILLKIKIFGEGEEKKRYYAIIALAMALGVIIPHATNLYPLESDPVVIINSSLPSVAGIIIALIMVLILIGSFGFSFAGGEIFKSVFAIGAFVVVLYIFGTSAGWFQYGFTGTWNYYLPAELQSLIVVLLVFGLIVWFVIGEPSKSKETWWDYVKKGLNEFKVDKK